MIRHLALDLDGTLYRGGHLFAATLPFLKTLEGLGIGYTFLTNNTSLSRTDYVAKLRKLGLNATDENVVTPAAAAMRHLTGLKVTRIALLGTPSLASELENAGFTISMDEPEAVVVGFDTTLTYDKLCRAAYWIAQGLPFLATHPDKICPTDQPTVLVDCGSITAALIAATQRTPTVFGKPDPAVLLEICANHGLQPAEMGMVGDRIYTDIAMAQNAGAKAILVLSGEAIAEEAKRCTPPPDLVVADVGELAQRLSTANSL